MFNTLNLPRLPQLSTCGRGQIPLPLPEKRFRLVLAATGTLPDNVNYPVKSSLLLSFLESVPDVANKLLVARPACVAKLRREKSF
jgi:hypothetical protein